MGIEINEEERIKIKTWNDFVSVDIFGGRSNSGSFDGSLGLMGSFPEGITLARDGTTILDDMNVFGQEWQVLPSEGQLFHSVEGPQAPERCIIPSSSEMRRRLDQSDISKE